jgi:hypothetical protein
LTPAGAEILAGRSDGWKPVTRSQARTLLDNLVRSGLAHRFNEYRGGLTYYSKTLSAEQIAENLLRRASRKAVNPKLQKLSEAIRQAKQDGVLLSGDLLPQSPHNAAFNAAFNAPKNASLNAEALSDEKGEGKNPQPHELSTEERANLSKQFQQLREAIK